MNRIVLVSVFTLVFKMLLTTAAVATTWHVPLDASTIQNGLDLAAAGDTVLVSCGTYHEHGIGMKNGVVLLSETGLPDCVTIDGDAVSRVLWGSSLDNSTRIEGFTITNGQDSDHGGGIFLVDTQVDLVNCDITGNTCYRGGGIYIDGGTPRLSGCRITDNMTYYAGGSPVGYGGGLYITTGNPFLSQCVISDNTAGADGGGIYCSTESPVLADCRISDNEAVNGNGGGIHYCSSTPVTYTRCFFTGNTAHSYGGGIEISSGEAELTLDGCFFQENDAISAGAVFCSSSSPFSMIHCTLAYNQGPAIRTGSTATITGSVIAFNGGFAVQNDGSGTATLDCCDVYGNSLGDWVESLAGQRTINGNFSDDPWFCDPHAKDLDLATGSPCLLVPGCGTVGAGTQGCGTPAGKTTWLVPSMAPTIQAGVDSALVGEIVEVAAGTYHEHDIRLKSGITLKGQASSPADVVIDAQQQGGVFLCRSTNSLTLEYLTITGGSDGGLAGAGAYDLFLHDCIFFRNNAQGICLDIGSTGGKNRMTSCTLAYNGGSTTLGGGGALTMTTTLIAFNDGLAVGSGLTLTADCCDLYGNGGGDWIGGGEGRQGSNGNISADPLFCDARAGDLQIATASPCLSAPGCGPIGALGQGCGTPAAPVIWRVPTDAPTIQAGIDSTWAGETVEIACGTYLEHDITVKGGITLRSATGLPDCVTIDAQGQGSVLGMDEAANCTITGLTLTGGSASNGGGANCYGSTGIAFDRCVFFANRATFGGGLLTSNVDDFSVSGCTFTYNYAPLGSAVYASDSLSIDTTILAFNENGEAVGGGGLDLSCSDVYGNPGGDWTGGIAGQELLNGNLSADPLFCDGPHGALTLASASPCLAAPGCGLVGALPQDCDAPAPPRVWHVPADAPTIQAGIDSAAWGDTVIVACGTYTWTDQGSGDGDGLIHMKSSIVLRSETGLPDCVTIDGESQGRVVYCNGLGPSTAIEGFTITGGGGGQAGGGIYCINAPIHIADCLLRDNLASSGGALDLYHSAVTADRCGFIDNTATGNGGGVYAGGLYQSPGPGPVFSYCSFMGNVSAGSGSVLASSWYDVVFDHCLLYGNGSGTGITYFNGGSGDFSNTIIASNAGVTVQGAEGYGANLGCCDFHGNETDYPDIIAGQLGQNGNISSDPVFCDADNGDFHLSWESRCLGGDCGQMGPNGQGDCGFKITSIVDISPDQGGQVRVRWSRAYHDTAGTGDDVINYGLWRRIDDASAKKGDADLDDLLPAYDPPPGEWDCVATVPAWSQPGYSVVSPTLCDSTVAGGMCWSVFFVTAHAADPSVYWVSAPDSGYSVDNLGPSVPVGLTVAYAGSGNTLTWQPNSDTDFRYFRVYRGTDPDFVPDQGNLVHSLTGTTWTDTSPDGWDYHYKITAVDFAGNESGPASPETVTGVTDLPLPTRFALYPNAPNPFNPATVIAYDLPEQARVDLRIYDVAGRLVRVLVAGERIEAGRRRATWDGRNDEGRSVAAGVYFCRLEAGAFRQTGVMTLVK